ncbi:unnamed protein product [Schistosoma mattheei]|uniref:Reverse transcriptase RNase H-like domain-containing protein n=1 Tax=Schistosoma mattheei TaxID=31246 RepID=A0A183PSG9_9TREM|nr:unnamed protein product [Schistosoma mattheei]
MVRQNDQKAREFILELQKQAAKCNFGDQLQVQLRDRLIAGINIPSLERELLRMPNCSFQDARTACINYEAVNELDIQSMKISNTLLSRPDELQSQGQSKLRPFNSDSYSRVNMEGVSARNYKANHEGEMKFGKCLSSEKFHSRNSCAFRSAKYFKCAYQSYLHNGNGFRPDMKRLGPLTHAPSLKNLTELRSLVGALQYYFRFIPNFSCRANCLFNISTSNSFKWSEEQESCLRSLLKFLQSDAVLRTYSPNAHSVLITDASPVGIGGVLEQEGRPIICVSRKLTVTERGYSQTQREALAVFWAVKRLHKYLFAKKFTIVTDHEALKFIYHPEKSLARSSAAMFPLNKSSISHMRGLFTSKPDSITLQNNKIIHIPHQRAWASHRHFPSNSVLRNLFHPAISSNLNKATNADEGSRRNSSLHNGRLRHTREKRRDSETQQGRTPT